MNTQAHRDFEGNDLPYIVALPAFTAAAWYYKKLEPELQQNLYKAMEASRKFAEERYSVALFKGSAISAEERAEIVRELARFTALPSEKIEQENLRISRFFFARNLLQKEQKQIGVLDSRYSSFNNSMPLESFADMYAYTVMDPSTNVDGIFTSTFQQYLRKDLKYVTEKNYEVLSIPVAYSWDYSSSANRYLNTADNLRTAMTMNPDLKVFVAGGYYDLVTTPFSADYIVSHLNVHPDLQKNIQTHYYESGHMMYLHFPSLIKLKSDLANFYSGK
jgi:carboxypeptidase C (cathepsin A)